MPTLEWLTRDEDLKRAGQVPYRLLEADPALSAGDPASGNMLIQGDNLEALKSLLPYYAGQVKCIYIDPPYNTKSAFEHYDDNLEHSQWLAMIWPRLKLLRELLANDGSIWVNIDDNEVHYLKVIMDEVFDRRNFVVNVLWQKRIGPDNRLPLGDAHDHILVYESSKNSFRAVANKLPLTAKQIAEFKNPDDDPRGPWTSSSNFSAQGYRPNQMYEIVTPGGVTYSPPPGRCWVTIEGEYRRLLAERRMWFGKDGKGMPRKKTYLREQEQEGRTAWSWWTNDEVGNTQESKKEIIALFGSDQAFGTPKPERLIQRILSIATNPGDLVLDSFLGSGTTAAVAQKMGRRWIGIEMGEHAITHCGPRLRKVIEGEQGGISEAVGWRGGGGFAFYRLGERIFDPDGRIRAGIGYGSLAAHVWFSETGVALAGSAVSAQGSQGDSRVRGNDGPGPFLGVHDGRGYALLYNGVLGDRRPQGGNVLTNATLAEVRAGADGFGGPLTLYGEASRLSEARLKAEGITFKQTPYDVKAR